MLSLNDAVSLNRDNTEVAPVGQPAADNTIGVPGLIAGV